MRLPFEMSIGHTQRGWSNLSADRQIYPVLACVELDSVMRDQKRTIELKSKKGIN